MNSFWVVLSVLFMSTLGMSVSTQPSVTSAAFKDPVEEGLGQVGIMEHVTPGGNDLVGEAEVDLFGGQHRDAAMAVFGIVPREERATEGFGVALVPEPSWKRWMVLDGLELRLRERVVIRDLGSAQRAVHAEIGQELSRAIVVAPDGASVYLANGGSADNLSVISTATNTVTDNLTIGETPGYLVLAITPDGELLYVVHPDEDSVSVISTTTDTVSATVAVGTTPRAVVVRSGGIRVTRLGGPK